MNGRLSLHFLPDYAPDLNPDMLVWSHLKRTGTARRPLHKGEKLRGRIDSELATVRDDPTLPPHSSKLLLKPIFVTAE
jgi:transposase